MSDEGVSQVTKSQADRQFPKQFVDKKYLTASQLKKDDLISRLQKLHKFLKKVGDAPDWGKEMLDDIAAALIQKDRLQHKSEDVRLLVACALADIIRIYAPEAPYDDEALKGIFDLFINQLAALGSTDDPSYSLRFYLLERLQSVRAFALLIDLDDQLYMRLYDTFFEVMSEHTSVEVVNHFLDIMSSCLEESEEISLELLEKILAHLLPEQKESHPHAFRLAQALIKGNAQLLETPITEFMSDILVNVKASTSELKDHGHALIWELNKISPNLLLYVMPELEKELTVEDEEKREDTVALLGKMFASDGSRMITSYPQLFNTFLKRFNDVEPSIRRRMVEYATEFIQNLPSLDLADNLFTRVRDTDEGVRAAAVKAICAAASANPIRFKKDVLQEVGMRMRDKKPGIRKQAMVRLAQLYRNLWNRTWSDDDMKKLERAYGWIPTKILHLYFQTDIEIKADVDEVVSWELLSRDKSVKVRTTELLEMLPSFDANAHQALARLLKDKREFQQEFTKYLQVRKGDAGAKDKHEKVGPAVAECFRVFQQYVPGATTRLQALHATKHKELWSALRQLVDEEADFKSVKEAVTSLEAQSKQKGKSKSSTAAKAKASSPAAGAADVLRAITYRLSMGIVSRQAVPLLLTSLRKYLADHNKDYSALLAFLHEVSASYPGFFADATDQLSSLLNEDDAATIDVALRMLAHVGKHGLNWPKDLRRRLAELCTRGTPQQSKHAVRALHCLYPDAASAQKAGGGFLAKLAKSLVDDHLELGKRECGPALAALAHIAKVAPATLAALAPSFLPWVTGDLLTAAPPQRRKNNDTGDASHQARLKALGLRLLANYTLAHHEGKEGATQARETVRLVLETLRNSEPERETDDDADDDAEADKQAQQQSYKPDADRELLRKHAVGAILRLAQVREIEALLEVEDFHLVAHTVRDPASEVREYIIQKLWAGVKHPTRLGLKWVAMLGLAALESDKKRIQRVRAFLANAIRVRRQAVGLVRQEDGRALFSILPEYALPYLIHLLAHRRDWDADVANKFHDSSRVLIFFLEPIITHGDNFTFLVELLKFIKQTKDGIEPGQEERMRILCDIGALYIKQRGAKATGRWLNQKRHPGDLYLPPKFFQLSEHLTERSIQDLEKSYLPLDFSLPSGRSNLIYTEKTPARTTVPVSPKKTPAAKTPKRKRADKGDELDFDEEEEEQAGKGSKKKGKATPKGKGKTTTTPSSAKGKGKGKTPTSAAKRRRTAKDESDQEEEEEEEAEEMDAEEPKKAAKARVAKRKRSTTPTTKKGKQKKASEDEEEEVEEEEEGSPAKKRKTAAATKKGRTSAPATKGNKKTKKTKKSDDEEEEEEKEATTTKSRGSKGKTASSSSSSRKSTTTKGKKNKSDESDEPEEKEEQEEEQEELPVTHKATRRGRGGRR